MSVEVKSLTKKFGSQRAVDQINFTIDTGQIVGFLGPNGAGKSTTMKMLTCFIPPTEGTAFVNGKSIEKDSISVRKSIGYLPEHNPLYKDMYVKEYLRFVAGLYKIRKPGSRVDEMIELTGLTREQKKKIGQLSKGYRQRVGLAQAMIHDPQVLILDEPTSGLDPNQLSEIREVIRRVGEQKTVMLSTHIMQEVEAICDRIIIINQGKIVADDNTAVVGNMLSGSKVVQVEFKEAVKAEDLQQIKGIQSVDKINPRQWLLLSGGKTNVREAIFQFAKENNHVLLSMIPKDRSLEDVFKKLTK